ncbi:MAG: hypothetical protein MJ245_00585 [Clostridia bacterium]|nr:hypothetical protein [Clostridia bacterium]
MKKNLFMTFVFSFIPGCGQMYQKYSKRGLSILIIAAICLTVSIMLDTFIFVLPFLVVEAYSFFDTFNLRNMTDKEREECVDDFVWNRESFKTLIPTGIVKSNKAVGLLLIIIGLYAGVLKIIESVAYNDVMCRIYEVVRNDVPVILIAIACVYVGVKMMNKKND